MIKAERYSDVSEKKSLVPGQVSLQQEKRFLKVLDMLDLVRVIKSSSRENPNTMPTNEIRAALKSVCQVFAKNDVEYILIGGLSVDFHGYHRISRGFVPGSNSLENDLDFWYNPTTDNYIKITKALDALNIDASTLKDAIFDPKKSFLRIPFPTFKVELLPVMVGVDPFKDCKKRAEVLEIDGNKIHVISKEDLIKNKEAVGREVDKRDVIELKKRDR